MNRRFSPLLIVMLLCTLLAVQAAPLHLHMCVDDGVEHGAALHLTDASHAVDEHPHGGDDREIELKTVGELRLSSLYGDDLPVLVLAVACFLLALRWLPVVPPQTLSRMQPASAYRLLPPSHAPPA